MSTASEHDWTEQYHLSLEEMNESEAIKDVESMNEDEILYKVNMRKYQQSYISDYLEYLWEISPKAFWAHINVMFSDETELLISDNMTFASILCNEMAPKESLKAIVKYAINANELDSLDSLSLDILSEIIQEQDKFLDQGIDLYEIYNGNIDEVSQGIFKKLLQREIENSHKNW